MPEFLKEILKSKKNILKEKKKAVPFSELLLRIHKTSPSFLFSQFLRSGSGIIAEIKKASPSKGVLFAGKDIAEQAMIYQENGASAISIVTEEKFFGGDLDDLQKLKKLSKIPLLRKDFLFDEYQILESKVMGADAMLLIVALLPPKRLRELLFFAEKMGLQALVEIHARKELSTALTAGAEIIGINNRDLNTFKVDLDTARKLLPLVPDSKIKIVESGIKTPEDLHPYKELKVDGFLIGEALLTASHPGEKLKTFCSILEKNDQD